MRDKKVRKANQFKFLHVEWVVLVVGTKETELDRFLNEGGRWNVYNVSVSMLIKMVLIAFIFIYAY